jgi:NADPH2:quinone reductase
LDEMRAVVVPHHGGPEVLQLVEMPRPRAGRGEVVVRVAATSINRLDLWARSGPPVPIFPWPDHVFPLISGSDCSGWIAEMDEEVDGLEIGQPVLVYPALYCGRCDYCRAGEQTQCLEYRIFGEHTPGAMAEYAVVPAVNVLPMPAETDPTVAATLPVAYTTAWRMLITVAALQPGESVLVLGVGGGVGSAALRIAHLTGATVFAAASSTSRRSRALELGAQDVTNSREPFSTWAMAVTDGRGVDVVVDPLGMTWQESIRSLARGGRLVVCGATAGNRPQFDIRELYQRHRAILGAPMGSWSDFRSVVGLYLSGALVPVIDAVYALDEARLAHERAESDASFGKIVLRVDGQGAQAVHV